MGAGAIGHAHQPHRTVATPSAVAAEDPAAAQVHVGYRALHHGEGAGLLLAVTSLLAALTAPWTNPRSTNHHATRPN
ncbi:hypothetical protein [Streptomyces colonosanans]|uniref:hypothetical protein n=1 Tax=Streptomyces colonosanans TaxID=1428652 RepID=UPI00115FDA55|nr:hypothetical protein [Streptomyces colonosanans]